MTDRIITTASEGIALIIGLAWFGAYVSILFSGTEDKRTPLAKVGKFFYNICLVYCGSLGSALGLWGGYYVFSEFYQYSRIGFWSLLLSTFYVFYYSRVWEKTNDK